MSADASGWTIRHSPFTGAAYTAHLMIADTVNDANGNEFWMSVSALAEKGRMTRGTAGKALAQLVDEGFVTLLVERPGGTNLYRFEFPDVPVVFESRRPAPTTPNGRKVRADRAPSEMGVRAEDAGTCAPSAQEVRADRAGGARSARTNPRELEINPSSNPSSLVEPTLDVRDLDPVGRVFAAWIEAAGRTGQTVLSPKRRRLIRQALADYPLDDVLDAVRGWKFSEFHCGANHGHKVYDEIELLLRDPEHIEQFRDLMRDARRVTPGRVPETWRNLQAMGVMGDNN